MRLRYLPIAVDELEQNAHWLDEHAHGRGGEFLDDFAAAIARIRANPRAFPNFEAALELRRSSIFAAATCGDLRIW